MGKNRTSDFYHLTPVFDVKNRIIGQAMAHQKRHAQLNSAKKVMPQKMIPPPPPPLKKINGPSVSCSDIEEICTYDRQGISSLSRSLLSSFAESMRVTKGSANVFLLTLVENFLKGSCGLSLFSGYRLSTQA